MTSPSSPPITVSDVLNAATSALGKGWHSDAALKATVKASAKNFVAMLHSLKIARPGPAQRARQYYVLRSLDARYCCILLGWPSKEAPRSQDELLAMARELNARRDCGEDVRAYPKKKKIGVRWISIFGPKRRALQRLAKEVLDATVGVSPYDYCRRKRGANRALRAMETAATRKGARWYSISDVRECYSSFDRERMIPLIPLPRAVIENCILIPEGTKIVLQKVLEQQASEQAVRRGIPQGSLASPAVAAFLLRPVLDKLSGKVVLCHGDDIVTGTKTEKECLSNSHALAQACLEHPAGPLLMKANRVARLGTPIDLLGYRMMRRWKQYGGGVRFRPSPAGFEKFYERVVMELKRDCFWTDDLKAKAMKKAANWKSGLQLWDTSVAGDLMVEIELVSHRIPHVRTQLMKKAGVGIYAKLQ